MKNFLRLTTVLSLLIFLGGNVWGQSRDVWTEDFDSGLAGSYITGIQTLTTGDWYTTNVYSEASSASYGGTGHAARINDDKPNSSLRSPSINTIGTVSFYYRELSSNAGGGTFSLEKSYNNSDWTEITTQAFSGTTYTLFSYDVNDDATNVYIRIVSDDQAGHLIIDEFSVTGFAAGGPANPTAFTAVSSSSSQNDLAWTENGDADQVLVAWNSSNIFGTPVNGSTYSSGAPIVDGGTVLQYSATDNYPHSGLTSGTQYFYKIWSYDGSEYSSGVTADETTLLDEPTADVTDFTVDLGSPSTSVIEMIWTDATGAASYLIKGSTTSYVDIIAPSDGTVEADGGLVLNVNDGVESAEFTGLTRNITYYFKIFPYTNTGSDIDYKKDSPPEGDATTDFYTNPAPSSGDGDGIINVTMGSIDQSSSGSPWYRDYSNLSTDVGQEEQDVACDITYATEYTYNTKIWVDWNNDGDFDDDGEEVYTGESADDNPTTLNATFDVPSGVSLGNHRLRIGGADVNIPTPEYTGSYACFDDYTINITAPIIDPEPTNHVTVFAAAANGSSQIDLTWNDNDGAQAADGFLIVGKTGEGSYYTPVDQTDPSDDTDWSNNNFNVKVNHGVETYSVTGLDPETEYSFKIYPYTNSGANVDFKTGGTVPEDNATTDETPPVPTAGVVFISEVSDASSTSNEFLELYNNSSNIIDLSNSKIIRYNSSGAFDGYVFDFSSEGSGHTEIPANGIIVISRGATRTAFESEWSSFPAGANFNEGDGNLYFGTGRQWVIKDGGTANTDDGTEIDATNQGVADVDGDFQYPTGTWTSETLANATPGTISSTQDPAAYRWDGGASTTNWGDADNWNPNLVPGANTNVTIDATKTNIIIDIDENADCYNLTVDGSLTIKSDETNTGSLLIKGTYSGTGTVTVERNINGYTSSTNGWHLLASPTDNFDVTGSNLEPSSVVDEEDDLFYWDNAEEDEGMWMNWKVSNFNLVSGKGYLVSYKETEVKNFVGAPYNADISLSNLSYENASPTNNNTWHLLGNPYTSALEWNNGDWSLSQIGGVAKVMDVTNGSYDDVDANGVIPAMQGFFVEVVSATNSMTIPLAARQHNSQNWYKSQENKLELVANDLENNLSQSSTIKFNNQTNGSYDYHFDSRFLGFYAPQFYSQKDGQQLSTSAFPELTDDLSIPMGFVKNEASEFSIELKESISGTDVYLTDLKLNKSVKLSQQIVYEFTSDEGDDPNRFIIHFGVVGVEESSAIDQINAYVYDNSLYVQNNLGVAQLAIYDIQGRQMFTEKLSTIGQHKTQLNLPTGIYIVRIQSAKGVSSQKVMIK